MISGFTFLRNAVKYDYPFQEAIKSVLPLCDEFVVAVGNSEDSTREAVMKIDPGKIRIIDTVWDESPGMKIGGRVFAQETDKAFRAISPESYWAFYIQGDEVMHEKYLEPVRSAMNRWKDEKTVDGLLFNYLHFYGSYDYVGTSPRWYDNEIRIIRNNPSIYSYRDAQGFRKGDDQKLNVKQTDAWIYHYGWVKNPRVMADKIRNATNFYLDNKWIRSQALEDEYDFSAIDSLRLFDESHHALMEERIKRVNWKFDHDLSMNRISARYKAKIFLKKYLGINTFYENYILV